MRGFRGRCGASGVCRRNTARTTCRAATHELAKSRGRGFTERYQELLGHYGMRGSKNTPGRAHENGDVESSHGGLKNVVDQRLRLRGSRDFASVEAYWAFIEVLASERNAGREARFREECAVLKPLPGPSAARVPG